MAGAPLGDGAVSWQPDGCHRPPYEPTELLATIRLPSRRSVTQLREPIRREVTLDAPVDEVWEALTTPDHLEAWFGAGVEVDARPGAPITVRWPDGSTNRGSVERVDPPTRFVFRWRPISGAGLTLVVGEPTRVEFTLEPIDGGTRTFVTVTEHDAPLPGPPTPVMSRARS
jgi:uncharacterized protein YndB with AHSA1/START domain